MSDHPKKNSAKRTLHSKKPRSAGEVKLVRKEQQTSAKPEDKELRKTSPGKQQIIGPSQKIAPSYDVQEKEYQEFDQNTTSINS